MSGKFQIIWIDNLTVRRTNLQVGENIVGNITGPEEEKQIIEPAAKIIVYPDDQIFITPCEGVSCYIKNFGALSWKSIRSNWSTKLKLKDTCLLFPVKIWFRVLSTMDDANDVKSPKRKLEEIIDDEPVDKRCRSESNVNIIPPILTSCTSNHEPSDEENVINKIEKNNDIGEVNQDVTDTLCIQSNTNINEENSELQSNLLISPAILDNREENLDLISNSNSQQFNNINSDSEHLQQESTIEENRSNNDNTNTNDQASTTSVQIIPREKCRYGDKCYRLSSEHKAKFSHPGDADYDTPDTRPECPYGTKCYRKNPQHKIDYKHTRLKRKTPRPSTRSDSPISLSDLDDSEMDESVDESDYDPSFIDDSDLEEFESDYADEE